MAWRRANNRRALRNQVFGGGGGPTPNSVWAPLSVMAITNPMDFGAVGNGVANDLTALQAAVTALPAAGGIVYMPPANTFRKNALWDISKNHVKLWAPNGAFNASRPATINAFNAAAGSTQAIRWNVKTGGGAFGLKFVSDAVTRSGVGAYEDMGFAYLNCTDIETVGCELQNVGAASVVINKATRAYQEHNLIKNSFADGFFHAYDTTSLSYNWANFGLRPGDDFVSVVTDNGATLQHDIETWLNTVIDGGARGYTVVGGGGNISIHHNWARGCNAAGILIGTESSFNTSSVNGVAYSENNVYECADVITSHSGILITAGNPGTSISNVAGTNNRSVNSGAQPYRTEAVGGTLGSGITSTGLLTTVGDLPTPIPTASDITLGDTTILRTRDVSHASSPAGLYRIHVRGTPGAFQQRFEWVVQGSAVNVAAHLAARALAGDYISASYAIGGTQYALYLSGATHSLGTGVTAVSFATLRTLDLAGGLGSALWNRIDSGAY